MKSEFSANSKHPRKLVNIAYCLLSIAASLLSRNQGLGVPIHIQVTFILINMYGGHPFGIIDINFIDCLLIALDPLV